MISKYHRYIIIFAAIVVGSGVITALSMSRPAHAPDLDVIVPPHATTTEGQATTTATTTEDSIMSERDARVVAEAGCIKGGEALSSGVRNAYTRTWWFDANLNTTRAGCSPACVVSEDTKTAEINWRCTGLTPPPTPIPIPPPTPEDRDGELEDGIACTLDAKLCPDGSYVGRVPPSCAFAPCPDSGVAMGTITGTVHVGPTCPVQRIDDSSCDDKPYQGTLQIVRTDDMSGSSVVMEDTATDGTYTVSVPYGSYTVTVVTSGVFPYCTPVTITVSSDAPTTADIACDSGIR